MKKKPLKHFLTIQNRKYSYTIRRHSDTTSLVDCAAANISQEFPNGDIPALLTDLPELILAEKQYKEQQSEVIRFRVTPEDKKRIEPQALKKGYTSVSDFLRTLALKG